MSETTSHVRHDIPQPIEVLPPSSFEIPPIDVKEHVPAILGLRRFIVATRMAWTRETIEDLERTDGVIKSAPKGARIIRGFKTPAEEIENTPITPLERITAYFREHQTRKITKARVNKWRIDQVHYEKSKPESASGERTDKARWESRRKIIIADDKSKSHDLGSEAHKQRLVGSFTERRAPMRSYQRTAEIRAAVADKKADKTIDNNNKRLDRGMRGRTLHGEIRQQLISRAKLKEQRLGRKLEELRQIRPEAKRINTLKRQERHARRHEM